MCVWRKQTRNGVRSVLGARQHEVNALANRPPIPKSHPVLDSLIDALEAEFVSETEGALTQWLEQSCPIRRRSQ